MRLIRFSVYAVTTDYCCTKHHSSTLVLVVKFIYDFPFHRARIMNMQQVVSEKQRLVLEAPRKSIDTENFKKLRKL